MNPLLIAVLCGVVILLIIAWTAIVIARYALDGTDSEDRARVLTALAEVVRALRGKR
ncbi:hypothetical protein [Streptomyces fumanus]|uniref:hypothetical protein n=1 Tax=Streptomyces fumanus TaxID=67302 RepID=UPI0033DCB743